MIYPNRNLPANSNRGLKPPRSAYVPPLTHLLDAMRDDGAPISSSPFPVGKGRQEGLGHYTEVP